MAAHTYFSSFMARSALLKEHLARSKASLIEWRPLRAIELAEKNIPAVVDTNDQKLNDALKKNHKTLSVDDLIKKLPLMGNSQTNKRHWWKRLISSLGFKRLSMNDSMATVVTRDGKPIGILPESIEPLSSKQLEKLAKSWVQQG
jgi:hypothetical protein